MSIPSRVRFEILRRDNHACRYCGAKAPQAQLEVDHVIPRHLGGSDDTWNLTAACKPCNRSKGAGVPNDHVIAEVRQDETYYMRSKGYPTVECMHCLKPIQVFEDEDYGQFPTCAMCDQVTVDAYQQGLIHGAR